MSATQSKKSVNPLQSLIFVWVVLAVITATTAVAASLWWPLGYATLGTWIAYFVRRFILKPAKVTSEESEAAEQKPQKPAAAPVAAQAMPEPIPVPTEQRRKVGRSPVVAPKQS